jgi:hypothetical protein
MQRSPLLLLVASLLAGAVAVSAAASSSDGSPLDGRWAFTWTAHALVKAGAGDVVSLAGPKMVEFRSGRWYKLDPRTQRVQSVVAKFTVHGDVAYFTFLIKEPTVDSGKTYEMRFSIYRDRLTWSRVPGRAGLDALASTPWVRVG